MLNALIFIPLFAGLGLLFARDTFRARFLARAIALLGLLLVVYLGLQFDRATSEMQFVCKVPWLPGIGLEYHLGIDGIGYIFLLLTEIVFIMALLASAEFHGIDSRFFGLLLLLEGGLVGTFTALNFLHFFCFWELSIIPAYFLVRNYGVMKNSSTALQFLIFTTIGGVAMLLGFFGLFVGTGTFDLTQLPAMNRPEILIGLQSHLDWLGMNGGEIKLLLFVLVLLAFAVKLPLWPFHGWLPQTYSEAPAPVTMVLTGAMSKMAVYGFVRILVPIFPDELIKLNVLLLGLAAITVVYGALAALAQRDLKRLFAYASMSHLGYCALGAFAVPQKWGLLYRGSDGALAGVLLQVFSHGLLAAALFAFVSFLERRNAGQGHLDLFGGLRAINPAFAGLMGVILFASLGLPGLSAFPAEFLIFQSAFDYAPVITSFAVLGILLTAVYSLTFFMKVFLGPLNERLKNSPDLLWSEKVAVFPALALTFILGIYPQAATVFLNPAITRITQLLKI